MNGFSGKARPSQGSVNQLAAMVLVLTLALVLVLILALVLVLILALVLVLTLALVLWFISVTLM